MLSRNGVKKGIEIGVGTTAIALLLAGCFGGGGTASLVSGIVADGYLSGATVCLDVNSNGVCDSGEPSGTTDANGAYSISVPSDQSARYAQYPVVAEVPATAIDKDTGTAVGTAFALSAPAGSAFVSPLTSLVQDKIAAGATSASAVAAVQQTLGVTSASGVSVTGNYVSLKGAATDQNNGYFRAHEAAKTVAAVLKQGKSLLGAASASTDLNTQNVLLAQAEAVLQMQAASNAAAPGTMFSPALVNASSVAGAGSLKAAIAAKNASAASATQAVTINFDVVNGVTAVGTTGCSSATLALGSLATAGQIQDLRFYVSDIALIDAAGNYVPVILDVNANQDKNVALLDFEDATGSCVGGTAATYTAVTGKVAPGTYVGVALNVGVPGNLNHTSTVATTTPALLQNTAMNWSWQSGRKFTKIEFKTTAITAPATTQAVTMVHLGATGCKANPATGQVANGCASPNRMHMSFSSFNPATQKIALDLGALFGGVDLTTSKTWMSAKPGGMMMAGSAAYFFNKLQIDSATGLPINDGATQTLFVVR